MQAANASQFDTLLATVAPELFVIWNTLQLHEVNPAAIPPIVRAIGDLSHSLQRLGEVIIEVRPDSITGEPRMMRVRTNETNHTDLELVWRR